MENKKKYYALAVIVGLILGSGGTYLACMKKIEFADKYKIISECSDILKEKKVPEPEIDKAKLLNGYLASYDKYTSYTVNDTECEKIVDYVNTLPTAKGMGFQVEFDESGNLFISSIEKNSQAEKQGLKEDDIIVAVDGVYLSENGIETAKKIGGKADTNFNLVVKRDGQEKELNLTRYSADVPIVNTLDSKKINDTLYVKIESEKTGTNIILDETLNNNKFDSVILDLRNNSGGDTGTGVLIADNFVSEGDATLHYYTGEEESYNCNEKKIDVPIVVLINEKTASAAEIITGILKQYGNTTLVGTNTLGKGVFQLLEPLENGVLKYTAGYFTVGDWECWQGKGITPDIEIDMDYDEKIIGTDEDIQLQKALELLN